MQTKHMMLWLDLNPLFVAGKLSDLLRMEDWQEFEDQEKAAEAHAKKRKMRSRNRRRSSVFLGGGGGVGGGGAEGAAAQGGGGGGQGQPRQSVAAWRRAQGRSSTASPRPGGRASVAGGGTAPPPPPDGGGGGDSLASFPLGPAAAASGARRRSIDKLHAAAGSAGAALQLLKMAGAKSAPYRVGAPKKQQSSRRRLSPTPTPTPPTTRAAGAAGNAAAPGEVALVFHRSSSAGAAPLSRSGPLSAPRRIALGFVGRRSSSGARNAQPAAAPATAAVVGPLAPRRPTSDDDEGGGSLTAHPIVWGGRTSQPRAAALLASSESTTASTDVVAVAAAPTTDELSPTPPPVPSYQSSTTGVSSSSRLALQIPQFSTAFHAATLLSPVVESPPMPAAAKPLTWGGAGGAGGGGGGGLAIPAVGAATGVLGRRASGASSSDDDDTAGGGGWRGARRMLRSGPVRLPQALSERPAAGGFAGAAAAALQARKSGAAAVSGIPQQRSSRALRVPRASGRLSATASGGESGAESDTAAVRSNTLGAPSSFRAAASGRRFVGGGAMPQSGRASRGAFASSARGGALLSASSFRSTRSTRSSKGGRESSSDMFAPLRSRPLAPEAAARSRRLLGSSAPSAAAAASSAARRAAAAPRLGVPEIDNEYARTVANARELSHQRALAVAFVFITWALLAWFVLVYGGLIFELLGDGSQRHFLRDWGVGLGVDNLRQWQDVAKEALKAAVVLAVLDRLGLVGGDPWLEIHLDTLSVQSTLFHGRALSRWQGLRQYLHYIKRVETTG